MKSRFWWIAATVLAVALVGQVAYFSLNRAIPESHAVWAFQPKSFAEVVSHAQVIAEVQVVAVAKGADITVPASGEPNGVDVLPTQRVTVQVANSLKGTQVGQQLTIFRNGGEAVVPESKPVVGKGDPNADPAGTKAHILLISDDPEYKVGSRYFLLLVDGPDGTLRPISPEGRYLINGDSTLAPVSGSDVATSVAGHTVPDAMKMAQNGQ